MDQSYQFPGSPGTPLAQFSPERVNQQRPHSTYELESPTASARRHERESSVQEKIAAFNSVTSVAFQGKQLERKANDAALKRAMLGREEAESEMRRYREEARTLRRQVEEGQNRERKVGERLESVMENYGRAKETHAHTQTLWEKEIRRARKENFKQQSVVVKLQEELKSARNASKIALADLEQEKERSLLREQEAFAARYQLVGVQEELQQVQEQIKLVEQERDALRTIAKNEEIARIAAEGRLPLPTSPTDDEFASPKKARKSLDPVTITSSAASEEELDDIRMLLQWEQQRANRAHDRVEFLELECRLNCCVSRASREPAAASKIQTGLSNKIFIPAEGIFRSVSPAPEESPWISPAKKTLPPLFHENRAPRDTARTPSCDPPATAVVHEVNTSLLSLLDAPHSPAHIKTEEDEGNDTIVHNSPSPPPTTNEIFHTISHTTRIPLHAPDNTPPAVQPDANDALSPTMSREEALAQIRERRGRARSLANGTLTPKKQIVGERRDISAPASAGAGLKSGALRGRGLIRA